MSFNYESTTKKIKKIEFVNDPDFCNIAFSDNSGVYSPTVLIFNIPSGIASSISINLFFNSDNDIKIKIVTKRAPTKVGNHDYFEAEYGGRIEIEKADS